MMDGDFAWQLLAGEKILWSGKPASGVLFTARDWFLVPFSLLWGGFAVFWETNVVTGARTPLFMKIWGGGFVLIGAFFILGRFMLDAYIRGGMHYAITNQRILISRSGLFKKFTAMGLDRLPDCSLVPAADGRGTIRFGQAVPLWGRGSGFSAWVPSLDPTPQLLAIEDAQRVFDQIQTEARRLA